VCAACLLVLRSLAGLIRRAPAVGAQAQGARFALELVTPSAPAAALCLVSRFSFL